MKIIIVTPTFFPIRGGTEQIVFEITRRLAKKHDVYICTPKLNGTSYQETIENVHIIRFPMINLPVLNILTGSMALIRVIKKLATKPIDLIHMFHVYPLGKGVVASKKMLDIPLIITLGGWDTYDPIRPIPKFMWKHMASIMNAADTLTTYCRHMVESGKKQGCKKQIKIITLGSDMPERISKKIDIRKQLGLSQKTKVIFAMQRLVARKGLEYLLHAIKEVLEVEKELPIHLIIGGKGPLKEKLEKMTEELGIEKQVTLTGFIPDNEVKAYYEQADLFVLPSLYEAFGLAWLDAIAVGTPVVATRCGGPEDIITSSLGILVPTRDSATLAQAINHALHKKWNKKQIVAKAKKYSWDAIVKQYETVYHQIQENKEKKDKNKK